jgi:hypothetical protein
MYTPYKAVHLMKSLQKMPYRSRIPQTCSHSSCDSMCTLQPVYIALELWSAINPLFVGVARTIHTCGVCTVILAGKSPNIRSYRVQIYGAGQPCLFAQRLSLDLYLELACIAHGPHSVPHVSHNNIEFLHFCDKLFIEQHWIIAFLWQTFHTITLNFYISVTNFS